MFVRLTVCVLAELFSIFAVFASPMKLPVMVKEAAPLLKKIPPKSVHSVMLLLTVPLPDVPK